MTRLFALSLLIGVLLLSSCNGNRSQQADAPTAIDSTTTEGAGGLPEWDDKDTTIYGRADGFGQSAFTFITGDGRELDIALTSEDGNDHYGTIYGDREDTARYAVTTRDNNESLGVMINISQLEKFTKDYEIHNGHLVLYDNGHRDLVEIQTLDDHSFVAQGRSGKTYRFSR